MHADGAAALPRDPPLPPVRPQSDAGAKPKSEAPKGAPKEAPKPDSPKLDSASPVSAEPPVLPTVSTTCADFLKSGQVEAKRVKAPDRAGPGCGIDEPVQLSAIKAADGRRIAVADAGVMRCDMARAFSAWVTGDFAAVLEKDGRRLDGIAAGASYDCRGRNRVKGAKLSEHGKGNALDIRGVRFAGGAVAQVGNKGAPIPQALFDSACRHFATVLGPGSDGYHEDHMHIDLAPRRPGSHYCRWKLP
ncbi:hypothetical protein QBC99_003470 [Beijerinckia sp. GAS462]|nr:hypothetical protein [Beijerinckia sp. GAS462]SEC84268.1 Uncharacterized conserved protein [Beijerinckia sp. 28-YEA-48]